MSRPTATASSQPQSQFYTAGRIDQLWTKADIAEEGERPVTGCLRPGVSTRQLGCVVFVEKLCLTEFVACVERLCLTEFIVFVENLCLTEFIACVENLCLTAGGGCNHLNTASHSRKICSQWLREGFKRIK